MNETATLIMQLLKEGPKSRQELSNLGVEWTKMAYVFAHYGSPNKPKHYIIHKGTKRHGYWELTELGQQVIK